MSEPLLVVEDTPTLQTLYKGMLTRGGHDSEVASSVAEAREVYARIRPRIVLMDLALPDGDGIDLIRELLAADHHARFIVITADGSIPRAVESMRAGASEFLVKPFEEEKLLSTVRHVMESGPRQTRFGRVAEGIPGMSAGSFIGSSTAIRRVFETIEAVSQSMATVFITGESGTGKEICAQAVHATSSRADEPFVPINCGAISPERLESEVFGHLAGSFQGAVNDKRGAAALADGGTLFLDDICEMGPDVQIKLLRFLQSSQITPLGAAAPQKVDVRIIAATNRDPDEMVAQAKLREDLYYRLHVVPIHMPPLRERGDDVIEIAQALLVRFNATEARHFVGLSDDVQAVFRRYHWPGNIRQLGNVLWNIMLLNDASYVTTDMLPAALMAPSGERAGAAERAPAADPLEGLTLAEAERYLIERAIDRAGGSIPKAARALDVSASTIYRKRAAWEGDASSE